MNGFPLPGAGMRVARRESESSGVAGPVGGTVGWYLGLAPAEESQYVVVVVVEVVMF